jgi:hypothetical protein
MKKPNPFMEMIAKKKEVAGKKPAMKSGGMAKKPVKKMMSGGMAKKKSGKAC